MSNEHLSEDDIMETADRVMTRWVLDLCVSCAAKTENRVGTDISVPVCPACSEAAGDRAGGLAPEHLTPVTSDRGFDRLPPIEARIGDTVDVVSVAEASTATAPHVWLRMDGHAMWETTTMSGEPTIEQGPVGWMMAHLTLDQVRILEEQLAFLRTNHYHHQLGDDREP